MKTGLHIIIDLTTSNNLSSIEALEKRIAVLESQILSGKADIAVQNVETICPVKGNNEISNIEEEPISCIDSQQINNESNSVSPYIQENKTLTENFVQKSENKEIDVKIPQGDYLDDWAKITSEIKAPAK